MATVVPPRSVVLARGSARPRETVDCAWTEPPARGDLQVVRSARISPSGSGHTEGDRRTFVLDTSVLLSDPRAMLLCDEHEVVLPGVVITELEAKRHHPELGFFARTALRLLDDLRIKNGRLDPPIPIRDSGGAPRGGRDTDAH